MLVFFANLSLIEFQVRYLDLSSFVSNRRPWVVLDVKPLQEYRVNTGVPQGSILDPTPFTTLSCHLSVMLSLILLSMLMILLSTLCSGI